MTIQEFINSTTGQYLLYPGQNPIYSGQCVQLTMLYQKDVQGVEPPVYPSAKNYWTMPGYDQYGEPMDGDIIVYGAAPGNPDGHIGLYYQGNIYEQNANPDGSPAHLYPFSKRPTTYLLGFLRKEGGNMEKPYNEGDAQNLADLFGTSIDAFNKAPNWNEATYGAVIPRVQELQERIKQLESGSTVLKPGKYQVQ